MGFKSFFSIEAGTPITVSQEMAFHSTWHRWDSGWFSVRCMVNTETNPDTALTFTFYSFSDNTILTESNLVKVSFHISVKLVLAGDAELGYQSLSTY